MTNYFVAKNGNDGWDGSESNPWLTIQKAANTLIASDIVYVKNGNYNERVLPQNSGSPGNYITYTAYPGDTVTIDGANVNLQWKEGLFEINNKRYIKISGLRVINSMWWGIFASHASSHIIVEKNYAYNCVAPGISAGYDEGADNIIIDGNEVNECAKTSQEAISLHDVDTFEIKNNHVHNILKEGIDAKGGSSNGKIYKNYVHNCGDIGIYIDSWDIHEHDIYVYQNIVHDCGYGFGIAAEADGLLSNINLYNNITYHNVYSGLIIAPWGTGGPMNNIKLINNTFYDNTQKGIWVHHTNIQNVTIRNNICSQNANQIAIDSMDNVTVDHNLIHGISDIYGTDYITGDPKLVNPGASNFHLQSDSPAINTGSSLSAPSYDYDEIRRPVGAGYDIGAYEYALIGTISGIVTDLNTGLPLSGVKILVDGYETYTE